MAPTAPTGGSVAVLDRGSSQIDQPVAPIHAASAGTFDERAVVAAVLAGDREAFRELVERESGGLVRACHRVLGDRHEAEDAAQEAFVTAYRALASWRGEGTFGAWLARIGVRIALRKVAGRRVVAWLDPQAPSRAEDEPDRAVWSASGHLADPALISLRAERSVSLRSAVARLDEPYRETIALRFFAERSLAEIAEQTGRPVATVKTHLHRGLLRLRGLLGDEEPAR